MKFISTVCWVKRGVSKTPTRLKVGKAELQKILTDSKLGRDNTVDVNEDDENNTDNENSDSNSENENKNEDIKISEKYNMDQYDEEDDDIKLEHLSSLACFASNSDDAFLDINDDDSDSDGEDFEIKPTDNMLICGHSDNDVCTLNAYVYNSVDDQASFYIHHDIILPSFPICSEWLDFDPTDSASVNYLAVGTLNPWIELWDLDMIDSLEPEFILGSQEKPKKKKIVSHLDKKLKVKFTGHRDAVLDLSWNSLNRNMLASGSADKTIVLWDLQELKQAVKIKHHTDKVQSLEFHPIEAFSLLSGSFDQIVAMYDCRNPKQNKKTWKIDGEVERVIWNTHSPNNFLCSDEQGYVYMFDIRGTEPLVKMQLHNSAVSGLVLSSKVPNLLVTASEDEYVKIWDIVDNSTIELVHSKKFDIGPINCAKASPDSDFVFAFGGGESSEPVVWDIRQSRQVRNQFFERMGLTVEEDEEEIEIEKEKSTRKKQKFAKSVKNKKLLRKNPNKKMKRFSSSEAKSKKAKKLKK